MLFTKRTTIATHNGSYHADEVFGCTALSMLHGGKVRIVRSRDERDLARAHYVVDVGGVYDPAARRFDHHQPEGAGTRANGIPYASFGLVWKEYGLALSNNDAAVWNQIDRRLCMPIDAADNGVDIADPRFEGVQPYRVQDVLHAFDRPDGDTDKAFPRLVAFAERILRKELDDARELSRVQALVDRAYLEAEDQRVLVIDEPNTGREPAAFLASKYPEPLYVVVNGSGSEWKAVAVRTASSFQNRKDFPAAWRGLQDDALAAASGVADARFCHRGGFLCAAASRAGAVQLAKNAVES